MSERELLNLDDDWPDLDRRDAALERILLRVARAAIVDELRAHSPDRPTSLRVRQLADRLSEEGHSQLSARLHDVARELEAAGA